MVFYLLQNGSIERTGPVRQACVHVNVAPQGAPIVSSITATKEHTLLGKGKTANWHFSQHVVRIHL